MPPTPPLLPAPATIRVRDGVLDAPALRYAGPHHELAARLLPLSDDSAAAPITVRHDGALAPQAYTLSIAPAGITIRHSDVAGLRFALITLAQLLRAPGRTLPALDVEDAPAFPARGLMLDISRDKVPTLDSLLSLVDTFEQLKLNHLQLYTEHTFAYAGHEEVWRDSSPITPDDLRALAAHCESRGVALASNQNCLGHLHRWFRHERYTPLAEIPGADTPWTFETDDGRRIDRRGPFSLCPIDPRSLEFVTGLLDQLLPLCPASLANIGFDEAYDVGQGRSRDAVAERGRSTVYLDFLRDVSSVARRHGKRPMFWADLLLKDLKRCDASALRDHIGDAIPLIWGYEGDALFAESCDILRAAGFDPWVCPGTSTWLSVTGRARARAANFARSAAASGKADGLLLTEWGDQGHRQHWPISLHAIAHGAAVAWNPRAPLTLDALSLHVFNDPSGALARFIERLGEVHTDLSTRLRLRNQSALYAELHKPVRREVDASHEGSSAQWQDIRNALAGLRAELDSLIIRDALLRAELDHTLRVAEHAADKALVTRALAGAKGRGGPALIRLAADIAEISEVYRELWLQRNRPGGLDDSAAWYEKLIDDYERSPGQ